MGKFRNASLDKGLRRWFFARALGNGFRANAVCECSLTAQQISVPAWYRLELENPRNPTVCTDSENSPGPYGHPLTGGPGFIFPSKPRSAESHASSARRT